MENKMLIGYSIIGVYAFWALAKMGGLI